MSILPPKKNSDAVMPADKFHCSVWDTCKNWKSG